MFRKVFTLIFLGAAIAGTTIVQAAPSQAIHTTDQGIHTINTAHGKLIVVAGTYQDTQRYKRSLSIYFQDGKEQDFQMVPIMESKVDQTTQWMHISRGETTIEDAAVVQRGAKVYLVVVTKPGDKNQFKIVDYVFKIDAPDYPDGPFHVFAPDSTRTVNGTASDTVEIMLDREIARLK